MKDKGIQSEITKSSVQPLNLFLKVTYSKHETFYNNVNSFTDMDEKSCYINSANYWFFKALHRITNWLLGTVVPKPGDHWQLQVT